MKLIFRGVLPAFSFLLLLSCAKDDPAPEEPGSSVLQEELTLPESMRKAPIGSITTLADGRIFITQEQYGGGLASKHNLAHILDLSDLSITQTESMSSFRQDYGAELLPNGKVLVIGGYKSGDEYHTSSELFDPATNTWSYAVESPLELPDSESVRVNNYIFSNGATLDLDQNVWITPTRYRRNTVIVLMNDGNVMFVGGAHNYSEIFSNHFSIINSSTLEEVEYGDMNQKYYNHSAILLGDGRIMVGGGNREVHIDANPHVEFYDPSTQMWTVDESQRVFESSGCLLMQPNGKVLAFDDSFERYLFDPATGSWTDITAEFPDCSGCPKVHHIGNGKMLFLTRENIETNGTRETINRAYITSGW